MPRTITFEEIQQHNVKDDCWVVIHGKVFDLTKFLPDHPGGDRVIFNNAGQDGTRAFEAIHSKDILQTLPSEYYIGEFDYSTLPKDLNQNLVAVKKPQKPSIDAMMNVFDFEKIASQQMDEAGWAYYSSGADDEVTLRENHAAFSRLFLRPRVLVDISNIDTSCTMLGTKCSFPIYITATALGKLAHPEGEVVLTRAAARCNVIQMLPTLASCSFEEMVQAKAENQTQWFQLYVNRNRQITEDMVRKVEKAGCKALCITVDAPALGRREKDMRQKFNAQFPDAMTTDSESTTRNQGTARAISTFIDPSLSWKDIPWFQSITKMPIVLKGIQCGEDALLAVQHGVQAIILSNHGGRQLDYSRSAVEVLLEVMEALRSVGAEKKIEVYVDGGIRRGTDIFKCLALGARGVGIGRPTLYGLASYGEEGVVRVMKLLHEEFEMAMRLMGTPNIDRIVPNMVLTRNIADHSSAVPYDYLPNTVYQPLVPFSKL